MKIAWITDPHLDGISLRSIEAYFLKQKENGAEGFIITGDIGECQNFDTILNHIQLITKLPLWFVLGNHDYWNGNLENAKCAASSLCGKTYGHCCYLEPHLLPITVGHHLITGIDGLYDGLAGYGVRNTRSQLNDSDKISGFKFTTRWQMAEFLEKTGKENADLAEEKLARLAKYNPDINDWIFATHVPPFAEASMYNGKRGDPNYAPFFVNAQLGERLAYLMTDVYPDKKLTVLCGHTHEKCDYHFSDNLLVRVGLAQYGEIITTMIDL